jgi:hypothetical protein
MVRIHEEEAKHINAEAFHLVSLIEVLVDENDNSGRNVGSIKHKISEDWSSKLVLKPMTTSTTINGEPIDIKQCFENQCVGFNEENFARFQKWINGIYRNKSINSIVDRKFIYTLGFDWIMEVYTNKQAKSDFTSHFIDEITKAVKKYRIHYPILHLDIGKSFDVGVVKIDFFTEQFFDELSTKYAKDNPEEENAIEIFRKKHQGKVTASCIVVAELNKAKKIALEKCSLAVDLLKIFSNTLDDPNHVLSLDIDVNANSNAINEIFMLKPDEENEFSYSTYNSANHHRLMEAEMERMKVRQFNAFHQFLLRIEQEQKELDLLVINSIKRLSKAFSNTNLHERIVDIFTVLESLLLPNEQANILDSLSKYLPKIVTKASDDRKKIIKCVKDMYAVRSSLVHHGKEKGFDINNLRHLQIITVILLHNLTVYSSQNRTKKSILDAIDEAIIAAG